MTGPGKARWADSSANEPDVCTQKTAGVPTIWTEAEEDLPTAHVPAAAVPVYRTYGAAVPVRHLSPGSPPLQVDAFYENSPRWWQLQLGADARGWGAGGRGDRDGGHEGPGAAPRPSPPALHPACGGGALRMGRRVRCSLLVPGGS